MTGWKSSALMLTLIRLRRSRRLVPPTPPRNNVLAKKAIQLPTGFAQTSLSSAIRRGKKHQPISMSSSLDQIKNICVRACVCAIFIYRLGIFTDMPVCHEYPGVPAVGQSSSVMLDQNTQVMITASRVNKISNKPPLILPCTPLQMCTEMTNWKICPMAKRRPAASR